MKTIRKSTYTSFGLSLFLLFGLWACKKNSNTFTLTGNIVGKQPQTVVLTYGNDSVQVSDTAIVTDGKFKFIGQINQPTDALLNLVDEMLWLEPSDMHLEIDTDKGTHQLTGSKTQNEQTHYYQSVDSIKKSLDPLILQVQLLSDSLDKVYDENAKQQLRVKIESLSKQLEKKLSNPADMQIEYIKNNPTSYFSAFLLYPINAGEIIPLDTADFLYKQLDAKVKKSTYGKKIDTDISLLKKNRIGASAPDFQANDPVHQRSIRLSDLRGKVVLLDFWAPWCGPCRRGFTYLKPLYEQYSSHGFEIIAIYTDSKEDTESWLKAIKDDNIEAWHHVKIAENMLPNKTVANDIRANYYVMAIPRKILIDREGNIANRWIGVSQETEKEVEELIKKLTLK